MQQYRVPTISPTLLSRGAMYLGEISVILRPMIWLHSSMSRLQSQYTSLEAFPIRSRSRRDAQVLPLVRSSAKRLKTAHSTLTISESHLLFPPRSFFTFTTMSPSHLLPSSRTLHCWQRRSTALVFVWHGPLSATTIGSKQVHQQQRRRLHHFFQPIRPRAKQNPSPLSSLPSPTSSSSSSSFYSSFASPYLFPMTSKLCKSSKTTTTTSTPTRSTSHNLTSFQIRHASLLSALSDNRRAYGHLQRVGRGPSSGRGKTSGRGHKGQNQHGKVPAGFQGGQTTAEEAAGRRGGAHA